MVNNILIGITLVGIASMIGAPGSIFFKRTSKHVTLNIFKILKVPSFYIGATLFVISSMVFITGLKFGQLSLLYPIASLSYIWVALLSIKFLKEKMNKFKWLGICFIIFGVVLISIA
ncbi:EamA family transporter [Candidatus Woesearchaeota archaeon]|nr:EamA family transporter [Candidatus Woesearchaeota archaeon]MBW3021834.1 EamA family transporter [Candidatus Woesearchaeota archaeon]